LVSGHLFASGMAVIICDAARSSASKSRLTPHSITARIPYSNYPLPIGCCAVHPERVSSPPIDLLPENHLLTAV
jgi:hypothetical protein